MKRGNDFEVIAEIGWNFMGDMNLAKGMVRAAKLCGAHYAKFQYWNQEKLIEGVWDTDGRREIYKKAQLDSEKICNLIKFCEEFEIDFLISCFNWGDAEFLKNLGVDSIKIPSHEIANFPLHEFAANNFKKCFVSLGAGSFTEIKNAVKIYNDSGVDWVGMHCVSAYPCPIDKVNLPKINDLGKFVKKLGFSDHTSEVVTPALAYSLGVRTFEKHFTTDNSLPGRDNKFALTPDTFKEMIINLKKAQQANIFHGTEASDLESDTISNYRGRWGQ